MAPRFDYIPKDQLPQWQQDGLQMTLIAGTGYGRQSPLPVHSPLFMLDVQASSDSQLEVKGQVMKTKAKQAPINRAITIRIKCHLKISRWSKKDIVSSSSSKF